MKADSSEPSRGVLVATEGNTSLVRITGRASFVMGPCVKQLGNALLSRRCARMVFDMADCVGADSTFLGVLAGLAARMKKTETGEIILINLSPALYENVRMLGLARIIACHEAGKVPPELQQILAQLGSLSMLSVEISDSESRHRTAIEAHEALIHSDTRNLPRFKDVLTFLRESAKNEQR